MIEAIISSIVTAVGMFAAFYYASNIHSAEHQRMLDNYRNAMTDRDLAIANLHTRLTASEAQAQADIVAQHQAAWSVPPRNVGDFFTAGSSTTQTPAYAEPLTPNGFPSTDDDIDPLV